MKFLHTMIRVLDLEKTLHFFVDGLGLVETRRKEVQAGRFTLIFLAEEQGKPEIELTYNWDQEMPYTSGRNFGHLAFEVENIYDACTRLQDIGVTINRPPRDGYMAFVRSPDLVSVELLQKGSPLPPAEPWKSMPNTGEW